MMVKNVILKVAAALLVASFAVDEVGADVIRAAAKRNPEFIKWEKQRKNRERVLKHRERKHLSNAIEETVTTKKPKEIGGEIPTMIDFSYLNNLNVQRDRGIGTALPVNYDPRDADFSMPPIRHQDPRDKGIGTCWAQASIGSMEMWLYGKKQDYTQLSVRNLVNLNGWYHYINWRYSDDWMETGWNGGNFLMSAAYLLRWDGPVLEKDDPYLDAYGNVNLDWKSPSLNSAYHVQQTRLVPARTGPLDNDMLKRAIMEFGGLYATMKLYGYMYEYNGKIYFCEYWNPSGSYFCTESGAGHAVTVVGWDDHYPRTRFTIQPPGDGAFIVRDSYGNDIPRDNGYIYVSYYDTTFARSASCAFPMLEKDPSYDSVYQYDECGAVDVWAIPADNESVFTVGYGANMFIAKGADSLAAVGFYAQVPNQPYTIWVYRGCADSAPTSGTLCLTQSGTASEYAGFHTIPFDMPVPVKAGERFSVVVYLKTSGTYPYAIEYNEPDITDEATASAGQSFFSLDGKAWYDFTQHAAATCWYGDTANFCCKVYTAGSVTAKSLEKVEIVGVSSLTSGKSAQFTCKAKYSDGSEADVTDRATWSIAEGRSYASVSSSGQVTAKEVDAQQTVKVHAKYTEGSVTKENDWSFYVTVAAPQPPTGLTATEGTDVSCIRVNWTAPSGASSYAVYRSASSSSGSAKFLELVTVTRYSDTDETLVPGTDYWYFIKAKNDSGTSGFSEGVRGWRKLSAPENVSATDGTSLDNVTVTWSEVKGAKYYRVYRSAEDETEAEAKPLGTGWQTATKYVDASAQAGVTYLYYVRAAINANGDRPSDFGIFDDGFRGVPVTLDSIAIDGASSIAAGGSATYTCTATYTDKSTKLVSPTWEIAGGSQFVTRSGATLTAKSVTGNQVVTLKATYTDGVKRTATKTITITAVKPSSPHAVTLKGTTTEGVSISWTSVSGASAYSVWRGSSTADAKKIADALTGTEYTDVSGEPGVTYTYWVKASNAAGESAFSAGSVTGARLLSAPTGVVATDGTFTDRTTVTWKPVAGATHYRVARAESQAGTKSELGSWQTAVSYSDANGTTGKKYWYFVKAATSSSGAKASAYGTGDEGWRKVAVTLSSIAIGGVAKLAAGALTVFSCTATYSDGTSRTVMPTWSASGAGSIDASGKFTAAAVTADSTATVTARYTDGSSKTATHEVKIVVPVKATAEIASVKPSTRWPFSGKLDVDYELKTTPEGTRALVSLSGFDNDKQTPMAAKTLSGDGAEGAVAAGKHRLTWDVAADYPNFHAKSFGVEMTAVPMTVAAPSNLTATAGTSAEAVELSWSAVDEATGYEVWRGTSSITDAAQRIETITGVTYADATASAGVTYYYWVRSVGADGISDFGKAVSGSRAYADITVTFNPNGGSVSPTSKTYSPTKTYGSLPTPTRTGYGFDGWYTSSSGGTKVTTSSTVPITAHTLWARWTAHNYTIRFNANGGSGTMSDLPMTYDIAKNLTANGFVKSSYNFKGWATSTDGVVTYTDGSSVKNLTADNGAMVTLYAIWMPNLPSAPINLAATNGTSGESVILSWSAVNGATGYEVWRGEGDSTSTAVKIASTNETVYADRSVPAGQIHYYWVRAVNEAGASGWSSVASGLRAYQYLVFDLSQGPSATKYPVQYLGSEPVGGWTDEFKTTKLVLRRVESGTFLRGAGLNSYVQAVNVSISKPFYIGVFEITQKQCELIVGTNFSEQVGTMRPVDRVSWHDIRGRSDVYNWPKVADVDPSSIVGLLRQKTGCRFDLPTEAQWEYACRAGTTTDLNINKNLAADASWYPSRADSAMNEVGRYDGNCNDGKGGYSGMHTTTTVGSYLPNAWGLYDMHGNVREWCLDFYENYEDGEVVDPVGVVVENNMAQYERILRGGGVSFDSSEGGPVSCISSMRDLGYPHARGQVLKNEEGFGIWVPYTNKYYGFRLCCPAEN